MMSGNVGGTDGNHINIKNKINPHKLAKLDQLVGKSTAGSIFANYDLLENGGNGNNFFDVAEINAIKTYLSNTTDIPEEMLAYFESENSQVEYKETQEQQPTKEPPPLPKKLQTRFIQVIQSNRGIPLKN